MYLTIGICPDIISAVTHLSQFSTNPTEDHYKAAQHVCVKFWTRAWKTSDGMTRKIISVTSRILALAYVLCHPTLLLSLFQKYRMEISSRIEEEIQEMTTREEWEKLS